MKKRIILGLSVTCLAIAVLIGVGIKVYLHIEESIVTHLKNTLNTDLTYDGCSVSLIRGIVTVNKGKLSAHDNESVLQEMTIGKFAGHFNPLDVLGGKILVNIELDEARIILNPNGKTGCCSPTIGKTVNSGWPQVLVRQVVFRNAAIQTTDNTFNAQQINLSINGNGSNHSWNGTMECQTLTLHSLQFKQAKASFTNENGQLNINDYSLQAGDGQITGSGTISLQTPEQSTLHFIFRQVPIKVLVPAKWPIALNCLVNGQGDYIGHPLTWQQGASQGTLQFEKTELSILSFMEKLSAFPPLRNLLTANLDEAKTSYRYQSGNFDFSDIVLTKQSIFSLQGKLSIATDRQLDGAFKFGVPTSNLALFPPLKEKIFTQENDGFAWTGIKITGTPDQIQEDLTPRLIALSQSEGSKVQDTIKQGIEKAKDWYDWLKK